MSYLVAAIVAMTNMCGVVTVDTRGARVLSYVPEGGGETLTAPAADGVTDDSEFEFVGVNRVGNTSTMTLRSKSGRGGKPDDADTVETEVSVSMNDRLTVSRTTRLVSTYNNAKPIDLQPQIEAVAAAGGGRVTVPPGEWLSKRAVHLRSNVELHLDDGAVLVFPDDPEAYLPAVRSSYSCIEFYGLSPLIYAYGATNVSVTGGGTLTTRMGLWRDWFLRDTATMDENQRRLYAWGESDTPVEERRFEDLRTARIRPAFVEFERCANVRLEGFRLRYSPLWCVHLRLCDGVYVRGLDIHARGHNNDGIDVDASRNVLIEDCTLDQGDDAFVIKSGRDRDGRRVGVPCENVEIRNCTVKRAITLLGVGSEVAGGVRNISLHDCKVTERANAVIRVKTSDRKGAYIENVVVSNVEVSAAADIGALVSLITNIDYQWKKYPPREHIVTRIDGFRVENVRAHGTVRKVYALYGDARLPPENIVIRNVKAKGKKLGTMNGFRVAPFGDDVFHFENCRFEAETGLTIGNADAVSFDGVELIVHDGPTFIPVGQRQ